MARSIRIEYPGAHYHVMARGNRRERIYRDDDDRRIFLKTLAEACAMTGWRGHSDAQTRPNAGNGSSSGWDRRAVEEGVEGAGVPALEAGD
jgi:hypothetical protein